MPFDSLFGNRLVENLLIAFVRMEDENERLLILSRNVSRSMAPADARVSESITKNRTRAFSLARCSRAMRSGVHCETCWKVLRSVKGHAKGRRSTYRIIVRNAKLCQLRHGDVSPPRRRIAGAAEKHFRRLHHRFVTRTVRHRRLIKNDLLLDAKRTLRRE